MDALFLINAQAGAVAAVGPEAFADRLAHAARSAGWSPTSVLGDADELVARAREDRRTDVILGAGGDGTIAALAHELVDSDKAFAPLPCGTMNLFCRDLGLPQDPVAAVTAALSGARAKVDIGLVETAEDGAGAFLNNVVFGTFAELAGAREKLRGADTVAGTGAAIVEAASALIGSCADSLAVSIDGASIDAKTNTLVVANNRYTECVDLAPRRARLDAGVLGLYLMDSSGPTAFAARLVEFLNGTLEKSAKIDLFFGSRMRVDRRDGPTVFAVDGERRVAESGVDMRILPAALTVLTPQPVAQ